MALRFVLLVSSLNLLDVTSVGTVFSDQLLQPGRDEVCRGLAGPRSVLERLADAENTP
jgi:hypothetical protein